MQTMTLDEALSAASEFFRAGDVAAASSVYSQILAQQPSSARAASGLGQIAAKQGKFEEAVALMRRAISLDPSDPIMHAILGDAFIAQGKWAEAIAAFIEALNLRPDMAHAHFQIGNASALSGRVEQAILAYRQALTIRPDFELASLNLWQLALSTGELDVAVETVERALALAPNSPALHRYLAWALRERGELNRSLESHREGLARQPEQQLHSDFLFTLNFHPGYDRRKIHDESKKWAAAYADPHSAGWRGHDNERSAERKLRVGYVADGVGNWPLGRFLAPLLTGHDAGNVDVHVYCARVGSDHVGQRLTKVGTWRNTQGMSDERLADVIRADGIDILVELIMHTTGCRLGAMARKPAPVQVTYLAYCGTTGVRAVDYRLTDEYLDPREGGRAERDACYAEESAYLPGCYWCYPEPPEAPEVGALPAEGNGHVTFGCLNEFTKVGPGVLDLWCEVLKRVSGSKLLLHAKFGGHRARVVEHLKGRGLAPSRLEFADRVSLPEYFAQYHRIDIALDPFPWGGGTTTFDALWMGVPVVTLPGESAVSRGGLSILSNLGRPEWVAGSPDHYVSIAAGLAGDTGALRGLRAGLRDQLRASPLMDGTNFAAGVEGVYRRMWRRYCVKGKDEVIQ